MNRGLFLGIQYVWFGISIFLMVLMLLNQFPIFRNTLGAKKLKTRHKMLFCVLFSAMGIAGTYWNVEAANGIVNFRAVGIMLGGFLGGPVVGTVVGLIAGGFRALVIGTGDPGIHGGLSVMQGILAGFLSAKVKSTPPLWRSALLWSVVLEILFWLSFLALARPEDPWHVVWHLMLPILVTNSIGVAVFIGILENSIHGADTRLTEATKTAFESVHILFSELKGGLGEFNVAKIADLIVTVLPSLSWAAVVYQDKVYVRTNFKSTVETAKGTAEVEILKKQRSLPPFGHILAIPVREGKAVIGTIFAAKSMDAAPSPGKQFFFQREKEYVEGISRLVSAIHEYERMKQGKELLAEAEIRALQAQINPHFLYNTLNTISFYIRSDPKTARRLISYLSDYFRHSLANPSAFIPLAEEFHVIACYMKLEQARFGDRLRISYHLPGKEHILLPPLLLQPLVENAVNHGVLPLPAGGEIQVGLVDHGDTVKLYVKDNGVGIPREKRKLLLRDHRQRDCIGLINVHQRLLSLYGPQSGLHIVSRPGRGTLVFFSIPKKEIAAPGQCPVSGMEGDL